MAFRTLVEDQSNDSYNADSTPFWTQFQVVISRTFLSFWRSPDYVFTRLFNHISIALVVGLTFLNLSASSASMQYRVFVCFFVSLNSSLPPLRLALTLPDLRY